MRNVINVKKEIIEFHAWVAERLPLLQLLKEEDNRLAFNNLMEKVMPEIKQYINRQLIVSLKSKTLPELKYKV